jgi:YHS domain-containing protein
MQRIPRAAAASLLLTLLASMASAVDEETSSAGGAPQPNAKEALKPLQDLVGYWEKGVGQPRRGSTVGAWLEEADWAWKFEKDRAALVFQAPKGKYFVAGRLEPADKPAQFRLIGTLAEPKTEVTYTGAKNDEGRLVFTAERAPEGAPARVSVRTVADGDRLLVLYERRLADTDRYLRLAEVAYTRKGSNFARAVTARECVVTGGAGTIQVSYNGQSYWVCCTGCRDLFNDDPESTLAEYRARKEAEKKKK